MPEVGSVQQSIRVDPKTVNAAAQEKANKQQPQSVANLTNQDDKVKIGGGRPKTIPEANQKIDQERVRRSTKETPALAVPRQNPQGLNLTSRQEPEAPRRPAPADNHSIRTGIEPDPSPRPPTIVKQRLLNAADTSVKPELSQKAEASRSLDSQKDANVHLQGRNERNQALDKTDNRRSPLAVQTQVGQNVNKLT